MARYITYYLAASLRAAVVHLAGSGAGGGRKQIAGAGRQRQEAHESTTFYKRKKYTSSIEINKRINTNS